jgi:hypothetical protein
LDEPSITARIPLTISTPRAARHNGVMPTEKELLDRIRYLEEQNSALQDKLDMIYAILAPDFEVGDDDTENDSGDETGENLVQIRKP